MRPEASLLPSSQTLMLGLNSIFTSNSCSDGPVISLRRRHHCRVSSFPSEVVTCRFNNGKELQFFYKYGGDHYENDHGHWGGISYEANVYRLILQPLALSRPVGKCPETSTVFALKPAHLPPILHIGATFL